MKSPSPETLPVCLLECLGQARALTDADLEQMGEKIWADVTGHKSEHGWAELSQKAPEKRAALLMAAAALTGDTVRHCTRIESLEADMAGEAEEHRTASNRLSRPFE